MTFDDDKLGDKAPRKFNVRSGGMSYVRFDEISEGVANGEPLNLSAEEEAEYQKEKEQLNASMRSIGAHVAKPFQANIDALLKKITPELDARLTSLHSKQRLVNMQVGETGSKPIFPTPDYEGLQKAKEAKEESADRRMDRLVELTGAQTAAIDEMVADGKNTARTQMSFNMWMLCVALLAALFALIAVLQ